MCFARHRVTGWRPVVFLDCCDCCDCCVGGNHVRFCCFGAAGAVVPPWTLLLAQCLEVAFEEASLACVLGGFAVFLAYFMGVSVSSGVRRAAAPDA